MHAHHPGIPGVIRNGTAVFTAKTAVLAAYVFLSALLLFSHLGHYPLWDDETMVALAAKGILRTGDTRMVIGENIVAYRGGILLRNLSDRALPPLSSYLTAGSFGVFGEGALSARIPFAFLGLLFMAAAAFAIARSPLSATDSLVAAAAILGNTSLFLFFRQCRYYAPSILLSFLIAACYLKWKRGALGTKWFYALLFLLVPMFAANYMICAALLACLAVDFLVWKRREVVLSLGNLSAALVVVALPCLALASVWNPYLTRFGSYSHSNGVLQRLILFWWNLRDMNAAGFMIGGLLVLSLYFAVMRRDVMLRRGLVALLVYVAVISAVSPQLVAETSFADIRYLSPTIPLCVALGVAAYLRLFRNRKAACLLLALPVFWTNLLNGTFLPPQSLRSVPLEYFSELLSPPPDPYTPAAAWVRDNAEKGSSVLVLPDYMAYPLMFHAPNAVYAWQLSPEQKQEEQFKNLPDIHFQGIVPPDYIVIFGPTVIQIRQMLVQWQRQGIAYEEAYRINTFWKDLYRPEVFWRTFKPVTGYDPETQEIYIFKKITNVTSS